MSLLKIFSNRIPNYSDVKNICLIVSCAPGKIGKIGKIENWIRLNLLESKITYVLRELPLSNFKSGEIVKTVDAVSLISKIRIITELRKRKFDIVAVCWTGEPGYFSLKLLAFLMKTRSILVFNENNDCFWLIRNNFKTIVSHLLWRMRGISNVSRIRYLLIHYLTLILLLPIGLAYVIIRVLYYTLRKYFYTLNSKIQQND